MLPRPELPHESQLKRAAYRLPSDARLLFSLVHVRIAGLLQCLWFDCSKTTNMNSFHCYCNSMRGDQLLAVMNLVYVVQGPEHLPAYKPGGRLETFDIEELVAEGKAG